VKKRPRESTSDLRERISAGLKELQEQGDLPFQKEILRSIGLSGDLDQYKVLREVAEELSIKLPQDATDRKSPKEMHQEVRETISELKKKSFRQLSASEKNERILEVLGNEKLTATEIAAKLNVYGGGLSTIFHRMIQARILDREPYKIRKNGKPESYIYFRLGHKGEEAHPEVKPETAQEPTKEIPNTTSASEKEEEERKKITHLPYAEKLILDALPERRWFKTKAIRRRIHKELSAKKVLSALNILVGLGYVQKDPRGTEKNPIFFYSKVSEKDIMRDFYLGSANIESIAEKYGIPPLRVTQVVTSEAGKLYASANMDYEGEDLHQQRKAELKVERELISDLEV